MALRLLRRLALFSAPAAACFHCGSGAGVTGLSLREEKPVAAERAVTFGRGMLTLAWGGASGYGPAAAARGWGRYHWGEGTGREGGSGDVGTKGVRSHGRR